MRDKLILGPVPAYEHCEQLGQPEYSKGIALAQCALFIRVLRMTFGPEPEEAKFTTTTNLHEYGTYHEVAIEYDTEIPDSIAYAQNVEENAPLEWPLHDPKIEPSSALPIENPFAAIAASLDSRAPVWCARGIYAVEERGFLLTLDPVPFLTTPTLETAQVGKLPTIKLGDTLEWAENGITLQTKITGTALVNSQSPSDYSITVIIQRGNFLPIQPGTVVWPAGKSPWMSYST